MRVALTHHWADDTIPEHRQRIVDMCLTIEEAASSVWLMSTGEADQNHGPTLVFDTEREWGDIVIDLNCEGFALDDFHAVSHS